MSSREEFEKWAEENLGLSARKSPSGEYQSFGMYTAWMGWQASRPSMAIDWPNHYDYTNSDVAGAAILDCRTAFGKAVKA